MRLGMMQPYFFPYLGYFALIAATDRWVVFDTAQYIRRGWVNRNRVLSTGAAGWKYVRVPVASGPRSRRIGDVQIAGDSGWREDMLRHLDCYRLRRAPYFDETHAFLAATLNNCGRSLCDTLVQCQSETCRFVGLKFRPEIFSQTALSHIEVTSPGGWALEVSRQLGAERYVNPPGGRGIFDVDQFEAAGVSLQILNHRLPRYDQGQSDFLPGLSIIDVLMWNGRERTRAMIDDYDIETLTSVHASRAA
ncbi:MAG: WbqC family protein [Planctomycetaceae bacterium]